MPVDRDAETAHSLLAHYEATARVLPWRNPPGAPLPLSDPDWPYRVWLSEVMLQQTTVAAVKPYFAQFTTRWPSVAALAAAADAEVMSAWAGLGYYARARNLLACARAVVRDHDGRFPEIEGELRRLPGIGSYTAAAIAAIAFGKRAVVIDGNVERVTARLFAQADKRALPALVDRITPARAGDFAQAMMDLGSTICTARNPACPICPLNRNCEGRLDPLSYPARTAKRAKPNRHGTVWWIRRDSEVMLVTRPAKGLLGGMRALPSSAWKLPAQIPSPSVLGAVTHSFTHFDLTLSVEAPLDARVIAGEQAPIWWPVDRIEEAGLPTVFLKAARLAAAMEKNE